MSCRLGRAGLLEGAGGVDFKRFDDWPDDGSPSAAGAAALGGYASGTPGSTRPAQGEPSADQMLVEAVLIHYDRFKYVSKIPRRGRRMAGRRRARQARRRE